MAALCLFATQFLRAQEPKAPLKPPPASDLFIEGYLPFGTFKFLDGEVVSSNSMAGLEYDRHSLGAHMNSLGIHLGYAGRLVKSRLDYAAEILPLVLLRQPVETDVHGNALSPARETLYGMGISPLGMRMLWLSNRAVKPFWSVKLGGAVFTQKALAHNATYANFTIQSSVGMQIKLTQQADLRTAFEFYHLCNAYVNKSNPGLDTLGINFGIVYHLAHKK